MSDRHSDLTPLQPEALPGGDTVPQRGLAGVETLPQSPLEGTAGLGEAAAPSGRDTVPFRGDANPLPDAPEAAASDASSLDAGPLSDLASPAKDLASPASELAGPVGDLAPATAAMDGGAGRTLAEAVRSVEGATELGPGEGPAFERDLGRFLDGAGQGWDVQSPSDIFGSGPRSGEQMPPEQPGRYDGDVFERQLDGALAKGLNVVVDTSGLSKDANADARRRADERPDWSGRIRFE